jgi:hypothetical protein
MRVPIAATFLLMTGISAWSAAPARGQTPADPGTLRLNAWAAAELVGVPGDTRLIPMVHWEGVVPDGPHLLAWVRWDHPSAEPVPGDTARFTTRIARMRFDCAGGRYQQLATLYFRGRSTPKVRVGASDTPGPWTAADTTLLVREMMDMACLPRDLGVRGGLPLNLPASRWTTVLRLPTHTRQMDTAGIQRHGAHRMMWMRDMEPRAPYALDDEARADTADTHYWLLRVDCATRRYRTVRRVLADAGTFVDSLTRPGTPLTARDPADADYSVINAVCGGPPARPRTHLGTPRAPRTPAPAALPARPPRRP